MKTKDKILETAIVLFNKRGINDVSIRNIGGEIGISSGNFAYHFKNKEVLLEYFYNQMYDEVNIVTEFEVHEGFQKFQDILLEITAFMGKYSFFYVDIVDIFRSCPSIREDYAANYEGRKDIYKGIFQHFVEKSLITIPKNSNLLDEIAHTIWFTLTFWQSQKKILPKDSKEVEPSFVINRIWRIIMPYMTDVGLIEHSNLK